MDTFFQFWGKIHDRRWKDSSEERDRGYQGFWDMWGVNVGGGLNWGLFGWLWKFNMKKEVIIKVYLNIFRSPATASNFIHQ